MITTIRNSLNIGALLCAFFSLSSYADVRLTYDGAQPSVFDIAHGKVLVSYGTMGAMLFEAEKNKIYVFDHAQKLYIDLDQMAQQVAAMKGRMREMFAAQTKGKTQAEVTQMKEAMGGVMASFLSDDKPDAGQVEMTFTGEQDKVGNYACEKVGIVLATGEPKTICVAAASTLGVSEVDAATLHSMMLKMTAIGEQIR